MLSRELIERQGFDSWVENIIVNCLEDGVWSIVADDIVIRITEEDGQRNYFVRAWTPDGWKIYEKHIPLPKK